MIRGMISVAQDQGDKPTQADRYLYFPFSSTVSSVSGWLMAVMDGHSHRDTGHVVPELCRLHIAQLFSLGYAEQAEQSLRELVARLVDMTSGERYSGSTLTLALVLESHKSVTIATMGDSIAMVVKNDIGAHLAPIHNVRVNEHECELAEHRGGIVEGNYLWIPQSASDDVRPYGLQISRGLGDGCMKDVILREPEVVTYDLPTRSGVLLITDGVCNAAGDEFRDNVRGISQMVRGGAIAQEVLDSQYDPVVRRDNATALLWSTF